MRLPSPAFAADSADFAAASLAEAMNRLIADYQKQGEKSVVVSLLASSVLAKQIEASSGADVFVSADAEWMDYFDQKNLLWPAGADRGARRSRLHNGPGLRLERRAEGLPLGHHRSRH